MVELPIISITILVPLLTSLYIAVFIGHSKSKSRNVHTMYVATLSAILTFLSTIYILINFDSERDGFQFVEKYSLIERIGLEFHLGIDGLSIFFVILTSLLTLLCIVSSIFTIKIYIKEFLLCFLLLEIFCIGVFTSLNLLLFFIFFEAILIPIFVLIGIWGGGGRLFASLKFFIYTFIGSLLILVSLIVIYNVSDTFDIMLLQDMISNENFRFKEGIWFCIFVSLLIKLPVPPFHAWLPSAHVEAPTQASVILAAVLLKISGYAFLRILLPLFPDICEKFSIYIIYLGCFTIIYASLVAFLQDDIKKMVAYSSIAHMGYVLAGMFSFTAKGISGAIFQMLSHGLISAALFFIVGILYNRNKTRLISAYGGVLSSMPTLGVLFMIAMLGSIALPGSSGFIGEFLIINGIFTSSIMAGFLCSIGIILSAIYMLRLYKFIMLGEASNIILGFKDLMFHEKVVLIPLIFFVIFFGFCPNIILERVSGYSAELASVFL